MLENSWLWLCRTLPYVEEVGSSCDSVGGVDSGEYAGMCPDHVTATHVFQAFGILLQI